jgi:penicillin-binding protein 1A
MRTALGGSLNIPAVQALQLAGIPQTIATAHSMGITDLNNSSSSYGLSLALGSGEVQLADHVNAYESFANGGLHYAPTMALKIYDKNNNVILDNTKPKTPKRVLDPQVAYIINNMLSDSNAKTYEFGNLLNVSGYTGYGLSGQGFAVKTGTTTDYRDAWTMGYTPNLVVGVWAGNNDNTPMTAEAADISAPMWKSMMAASMAGKPIDTFPKPSGIQTLTIPGSAYVSDSSSGYKDLFPSWYKNSAAKSVVIDIVSGLLATPCTPPLAQKTVNYSVTGTDDVHSCSDAQPTVTISGLSGGGPTYNGTATVVAGKFNPDKLDITLDDQIVSTQAINGAGTYTFSFTTSASGSHSVRAIVTDDGYYQGTSDVTAINVSGGSSVSVISPGGNAGSAGPITFEWTPDSNASSYQLYIDGSARGGSTTATSEVYPVLNKTVTHTWYVVASNGDQSAPISFTVQ